MTRMRDLVRSSGHVSLAFCERIAPTWSRKAAVFVAAASLAVVSILHSGAPASRVALGAPCEVTAAEVCPAPYSVFLPLSETVRRGTPATPRPLTPSWPCPSLTPTPTSGDTSTPPTGTASTGTATPTASGTPQTGTPQTGTPATGTAATGTAATGTATGTEPAITLTPTAAPPSTGVLGAQVFEADIEPIRDGALNAAGARWARARVLWAAVEPADTSPRTRDWAMSDSLIRTAADQGLELIVAVYKNPAWAATTSCGPVDLAPLARYAEFLGEAVERYDGDGDDDAPGSPRVSHWEIGNEPDFDYDVRAAHPEFGDPADGYGSCFGGDPAAYADLLAIAYDAVKSADPTARVVFGAVAYDRFFDHESPSPQGPFRYDFVGDVLQSLTGSNGPGPGQNRPFFDVMAFHNYNDFRDSWDGPDGSDPEIVGKSAHLRENQMVRPGVFDLRDKPLLTTEVGVASAPSDEWTERSESYQAAYVGQVMVRSMAAGLEAAIWYTTEDNATGACDDPWSWLTVGLLRSAWVAQRAAECDPSPLPGYEVARPHEPKPALAAFRAASDALSGATYVRQLSPGETGGASVEAHRVDTADGRAAMVAFTDHGERLGKRGAEDVTRTLRVDSSTLPGWTGRVRVTDYIGESRVETGDSVTVWLTYEPTYLVVEP